MLHNLDKKTKIELPEELLCAYVDGQTTPQEDREMLEMLAKDETLAKMHDDLKTVMDIINMEEEEMSDSCPMAFGSAAPNSTSCIEEEAVVNCCNYTLPPLPELEEEKKNEKKKIEQEALRQEKKRITKELKEISRFDSEDHFSGCEESVPMESKSSKSLFRKLFDRSQKMMINPHSRVTPRTVKALQSGEIFVFGSNPWGLHDGGASKLAKRYFGAIQGQGEGRQGQSYAIPTIVGGVDNIRPHVIRFLKYAKEHPELHFIVTRIGCGTAGFNPEDIAPLFVDAKDMSNISLPEDFWNVINRL